MKKTIFLFILVVYSLQVFSQDIDESTRKKFSIVFDLYTDIWVNVPENVDVRTINQGVNVLGLYDYRINQSDFSFAFGAGLGSHNFHSDAFAVRDSVKM